MKQYDVVNLTEPLSWGDRSEQCEVLVIDDDPDFLAELSEALESLDYPVRLAISGREGLRQIAENDAIGIVLCDVRLPDIDGTELVAELVARFVASRPLVLVLMSGHTDLELALNALRLGVDDFVQKPLRYQEIARCMRSALRTWRMRQASVQSYPVASLQSDQQALFGAERGGAENEALLIEWHDKTFEHSESQNLSVVEMFNGLLLINRERDRLLEKGLFGDPAWDIVLELTRARLRGEAIPVSSACTASNAPLTTSLRWIRNMHKAGILRRWNDPRDKRRDLIELSDEFYARMLELFESVRQKRRNPLP